MCLIGNNLAHDPHFLVTIEVFPQRLGHAHQHASVALFGVVFWSWGEGIKSGSYSASNMARFTPNETDL